jgi:hypothetical protein
VVLTSALTKSSHEDVHALVAAQFAEPLLRLEDAESSPATDHGASRQRFTRRCTRRMEPFRFSIGLVVDRVRSSASGSFMSLSVSVSSSPSRNDAAAPGWSLSRRAMSCVSLRFAMALLALR